MIMLTIAFLFSRAISIQRIVVADEAGVVWEMSTIMNRYFGILMIGLTTGLLASTSTGSVSIEQAIQKRIAMFKSSGENIKKLNKLIRVGDTIRASELVNFHVTWSRDMSLLFPIGSEASTTNGSDASLDIWDNQNGFKNAIKQYYLSSKSLRESLRSADSESVNETFKSFVGTCKSCHKQFRN